MLVIENVSKKFGDLAVLKSVSLKIADHSITGLAGASGGGKSTLLRCIQGLETLDEGTISGNQKSGFMFQDFQLFPHMTVLDTLIYAPKLNDRTKDHTTEAFKILAALGIKDKQNVYPIRLSGGQKQRVALARSLMMNPKLLLCDEPTSGLDVATIGEVIGLLEAVRGLGVTMVIASHDLDFLTKIADRIVVLKDGSVSADINPKTVDNPINTLKHRY